MLIFDYENAPKCVKMHIMEVSLEMCFWCFREIGTTVKHRRRGWITLTKHADHASPYSYSRNNSKSNIVTACNLCNQWKGSRVFESDDACRQYLEQKWRNKIYEEMSVLPSGVYAEAELAGVLQPEMPQRALAQEPVPRVSKVRNNGLIRDQGKEKTAEKAWRRCRSCGNEIRPKHLRKWYCGGHCYYKKDLPLESRLSIEGKRAMANGEWIPELHPTVATKAPKDEPLIHPYVNFFDLG